MKWCQSPLPLWFAVLAFSACEIGLGVKINTETPIIGIPDDPEGVSSPGSFLSGSENIVYIDAFQNAPGFKINSVFLTLDYFEKNGGKRSETVAAYLDVNPNKWAVNIDTILLNMEDGKIKAWATAVDNSGKKTTSTDIIYFVKNLPPQIQMTIPAIKPEDFADPNLDSKTLADTVYIGTDLTGIATDNMGIAQGFPKIMIWPSSAYLNTDNEPVDDRYNGWHELVVPKKEGGLTVTKFSWPMYEPAREPSSGANETSAPSYLRPGEYHFKIWIKDVNGKDNFYPYHPNKYIKIKYAASEIPVISFTDVAQYYNGKGDFTARFNVTSSSNLSAIEAFIRDTDDGSHNFSARYSGDAYFKLTGQNGNTYGYELRIPQREAQKDFPLKDGNLFVFLSAEDSNQRTSPVSLRNFIYDTQCAKVVFDRPANIAFPKESGKLKEGNYEIFYPLSPQGPKWVTGKVQVGGTAKDAFGIKEIFYHIGKLGDDGVLSDEKREKIYKDADWTNAYLHTPSPSVQDNFGGAWSGTVYSWVYTCDFNALQNKGNLIQEEKEIGYSADDNDYRTTGETRFYLPFYVKTTDNAGNINVTHYKICVDPDLDIPTVDIIYPAAGDNGNDPLVGGEIRISGIANDNNAVHTVQARIKKIRDDGSYEYYIPQGMGAFYPNSSFPVFADEKDPGGWFKVNTIGEGNSVNWYCIINSDGGLDPQNGNSQAKTRIEVRAFDTKDIINRITPDRPGPASSLNVLFSSGVPTISNPIVKKTGLNDRQYTDNMRVSGQFTVTATLRDDDGIRLVKARFNGEPFTKIVENANTLSGLPSGWDISQETYNPALKKYERTLSVTVDTTDTKTFPSLGYGKTGNIIFDVQIVDMNQNLFSSSGSYNIGIDNFYPETLIETHNRASGRFFPLRGKAKDYNDGSGAVQGIERVLVFFERAVITGAGKDRKVTGSGRFVNQNGKEWSSLSDTVTYPHVRDTTIADGYGGEHGPNTPVFKNFPSLKLVHKENIGDVWESEHAMVIDRQEFGEDTDIDRDGTFGEVWDGNADIEWMARFNTVLNGFPDGPLLVHYIVMDGAGNASRYREDIYIENNKPLITGINLGTDWNGDGNVAMWINNSSHGEFLKEKQTIGLTTQAAAKMNFAPEFRIRNNRFTLMLDTTGGNGEKEYRVSYVTQESAPVSASALETGKVYTIVEHGGIDWVKYGAANNNINTTFVATGKHKGNTGAKAVSYNEHRVKGGIAGAGNATVYEINFTEEDFGQAQKGLIPDSEKDASGTILPKKHNERLFIVKVFDSTVEGRMSEDQNAHAVLIAVDVDNADSAPPEIYIEPFYWKSNTDNSLYENSRDRGHIELESDLPKNRFGVSDSGLFDGDPKVSGVISVRGTAFDNNTIESVLFAFSPAAQKTAAIFDPEKGWTTYGDIGAGWRFNITESFHDLSGHHVKWRLDIDTAKIAGKAAATDRVLTLSARDNYKKAPNISAQNNEQTSAGKKSPYYRMDIVPYIRKVSTFERSAGALKDQNIRSSDGKYSVKRDKKNTITVEGFNLNPCGTKGAVRILSGRYNENKFNPFSNPPAPGEGVVAPNVADICDGYNLIEIENGDDLTSGFLTVWTDGIASLNNINDNDAKGSFQSAVSGTNAVNGYNQENMPNREADRYTTKNITLTDDRYLRFFHVTDTKLGNSGYPVMIMNKDNPVFGYVKDNGGSASAAGNAAGTGAGSLNPTYAAPQRREVDGVTGEEIYTEYLIKGSMWDGMGMTRDSSGRYLHATTFARDQSTFHLIYDRFSELHSPSSGNGWGTGVSFGTGGLVFAHNTNNNAFSLETVNYSGALNIFRYQYPKLIAKGNSNSASGAVFYLLYFDETTKELAFRNFKIVNNKSATPPLSTAKPQVNWTRLSGTGNDSEGNSYGNNHTNMRGYDGTGFVATSGVPSSQYDNAQSLEARKLAASNASKYFDFAVTENNRVIIVYYDESASRLKMRYSSDEVTGEVPTMNIAWTDSKINFPPNVGMYVSMTADGNTLHISANDGNNGDLMYIVVSDYTKTDFKAVAVDKFGTTGNWTDIKLKPGTSGKDAVPYIAYFNMADIGSRDGNKIARLKSGIGDNPVHKVKGVPEGADANGFTTGMWEYMTVPAITAPQGGSNKFQKVNLGFRTDGTPVIGYLSSNIEFAYPVGEG